MSDGRDMVVLVGSLRKGSFTRMVARELIALTPPSLRPELVEIRDLALYDQDLEADPPPAWRAFRERLHRAQAFLFVTPEYNRSVPAPMKNAIDVGSRPHGGSGFTHKPGGVVSVSPGALAAFGANHHLRQSLVFLDVLAMQQPEAYIGGASKLFDADGKLQNDSTREFLRTFMAKLGEWVEKVAS